GSGMPFNPQPTELTPGPSTKRFGTGLGIPCARIGEALSSFESPFDRNPGRLNTVQQMALFPETSPILDELKELDVNSMSPLEAMTKLYEWQRKYGRGD
ncbi:MAG TPA: hypothetical protein EYP41_19020, partial [Anaerolineae bacterium]|nr:hypothetical protein [Anaerolineae bacterium]